MPNPHPLPYGVGSLLGTAATLVKGAAPNTDTLLVPPPPVSPNGIVSRSLGLVVPVMNNSGVNVEAGAGNLALMYKAEGALEVIMNNSASALLAGGTELISASVPFLIAPTDRGIFLRLGDLQAPGPVDFPGTLDSYANYLDFRDYARVSLDLTDVFQTILEGVEGATRFLGQGGGDFSEIYAAVANFDSAPHTVEIRLSNGVDTILIPAVSAAPAPAGILSSLGIDFTALQEDWFLEARTTVAAVVRPVRLILAYTEVGVAPALANLGGAF